MPEYPATLAYEYHGQQHEMVMLHRLEDDGTKTCVGYRHICPHCGRWAHLRLTIHTITFDENGKATVSPSIGCPYNKCEKDPCDPWFHVWLEHGVARDA
jgi:hypothetical protein